MTFDMYNRIFRLTPLLMYIPTWGNQSKLAGEAGPHGWHKESPAHWASLLGEACGILVAYMGHPLPNSLKCLLRHLPAIIMLDLFLSFFFFSLFFNSQIVLPTNFHQNICSPLLLSPGLPLRLNRIKSI